MPKSNPVTPTKQPPENWNQLITEFLQKGGRGLPKTFIKKLWAVQEDLLANANPSSLRMMYFSPPLTVCPEGVKLAAEILTKIGVITGLTLLEKRILKFDMSDAECQRYGDVLKTAWKNAYQDANFDLIEEIESEVITVICQHALYGHKPTCTKFQKVLAAFAHEKKQDKNLDEMMTRLLNGCLYRALDSTNYIVQSSAAEVLFMFYPLIGEDSEDMAKSMENQHRYMFDLLRSDIVSIRTEAVKNVLKSLCDYWLIFPKQSAKEMMGYIIDTLSKDTVVGVRVAVFEGLNEMVFVPACLSVFEYGLKCAVVPAIQDKSERVRLAAYQLLARLKNHKFISVFDIVERDQAIAKLDLESVETCRRQLIPIMHILLPISKTLKDEYYRPRVNYILDRSREAILCYFRLLGPMKIIDAAQAEQLIEMCTRWAYRYLRKKDEPPLPETSDGYKRARAYLECALVLYMSCKGMLMSDPDGTLKAKCDQKFGKVVKEIFEKYANTPILGTATAISSVIPKEYLKSIANDILARLADDDVPSEAVEPFLESAIHFNPDSVFDSFDSGLNVLVDMYGDQKKQSKKKKRDVGNPEEVLKTTLNRFKYLLQSHSTSSLIAMRDVYRTRILELLTKVDLIREAIEVRLVKGENEEHAIQDETLLSALELRFVLPLFAATNGCEDDNDRKTTIESMKQLIIWFEKNIAEKMTNFGDHNQDFLIDLSCTFLNCLNVSLSAYDFKTRPLEFEDEEDDENRPPEEKEREKEDETTVAEIIDRIVTSFCNSDTPLKLFGPMLRVGSTLCEEAYSETHSSMARLLRFIPKWIKKQCEVDDEENFFDRDKEIVEALRQFHKKVSDTDCWDEDSAARMISLYTVFSFFFMAPKDEDQEHDDQECEDPRGEEYKPPRFISLTLLKFILKDKTLTDDLMEELAKNYLPGGSKYFMNEEKELTTGEKLINMVFLSKFLRILERYSKSHAKLIKESIETCTTRVLNWFANAPDLDTVDHQIMNSLSILLDVELPDGF